MDRHGLILLAFLLANATGCQKAETRGLAGETDREEPKAERQTGKWGPETHGLQIRTAVPAQIEVGMPFKVKVEIRCEQSRLDPGIKRLNDFLRDDYLELSLTNLQTQKTWTIKPYDPTGGMPPPPDTGKSAVPLDGSKIKSWPVTFPLVKVYDELKPGAYVARVLFTYPKKPRHYWRGGETEWKKAGFWHGRLSSAPFPLRLLEETPKTETLSVPRELRLRKESVRLHTDDAEDTPVPAVYFDKPDAEQIKVPVRNGHFVGTWLYRNGEPSTLCGGLLTPNSLNAIDAWYDYKGGGKKVSYTIEVFETAEAPQHGWMPGPGSAGYKVLWKKTFSLSFTADEIRRVIVRKSDRQNRP